MAKIIPGASAQAVKKKQYLVLGLIAGAVVLIALVAGYLTDANKKPGLPVADATKPVLRNIALPGENLKEEQSWRAIEGARLEAIAKDVTSLRAENDAMRKELTSRGKFVAGRRCPATAAHCRTTATGRAIECCAAADAAAAAATFASGRSASPWNLARPADGAPRPAIATVSFDDEPGPSTQAGASRQTARRPARAPTQRPDATGSSVPHNPETYLARRHLLQRRAAQRSRCAYGRPGAAEPSARPHTDHWQRIPAQQAARRSPWLLLDGLRARGLEQFQGADKGRPNFLHAGRRRRCDRCADQDLMSWDPTARSGVAGTTVSQEPASCWPTPRSPDVLSGLAAVAQSYATVNSVSPLGTVQTIDSNKIPQYAAASGIQSAADKLAACYMKMSDATLPMIEIPTGVAVDVVLQRGLSLDTNSR